MRVAATVLSLGLVISSAACAQKAEGEPESVGMPRLSAINTIATCFMDHPGRAERQATCRGQYTEDCVRQSPAGTTYTMMTCAREEADAWQTLLDRELNSLVEASRSPQMDSNFIEAHSAWEVSREADCRYAASFYEGGSMAGVVSTSCFSEMTSQRFFQVNAWLDELTDH